MHNITETNVVMLTGVLAMGLGAHFHHDLILGVGVVICAQAIWRYLRK